MTQKPLGAIAALTFLAVYSAVDSPANAIELITNGDFETGDYLHGLDEKCSIGK